MKIKVKVQPNEQLAFPNICVVTGQPATTQMTIAKQLGQTTRTIHVPVSVEMAKELARRSAREEQLQTLSWVALVVVLLSVTAVTLLLTPDTYAFILRLLLALAIGSILAQLAWQTLRQASQKAILPTKQKVLASAKMIDFSWHATTFEFTNPAFAEQFRTLNEKRLMESDSQ